MTTGWRVARVICVGALIVLLAIVVVAVMVSGSPIPQEQFAGRQVPGEIIEVVTEAGKTTRVWVFEDLKHGVVCYQLANTTMFACVGGVE